MDLSSDTPIITRSWCKAPHSSTITWSIPEARRNGLFSILLQTLAFDMLHLMPFFLTLSYPVMVHYHACPCIQMLIIFICDWISVQTNHSPRQWVITTPQPIREENDESCGRAQPIISAHTHPCTITGTEWSIRQLYSSTSYDPHTAQWHAG